MKLPGRKLSVALAVALALASTGAWSADKKAPAPTIGDLSRKPVEVRPDGPNVPASAGRAMENYRRFLDLQRADPKMRADALRRLGDLSLESGELERMESDALLGALGTQFVEIDEAGQRIAGGAPMPVGTALVHDELERRQPIANPTAMFRTQILRDVGLYREAFRYCEDYDLFLRLSKIARIDNLSEALLLYRRSPGQMSVLNHGVQTRQAAYARLAYHERLAGRPDPFAGADTLPMLSDLDRVLGRAGVSARLEAEILFAHRYAVASMKNDEFADYCAAIANGTKGSGLRAVARCLVEGKVGRALRLVSALIKGRLANRASRG